MPKQVAERIAEALRARIGAGDWAGMGRLPAERELAAEYGVARNTMRRAIAMVSGDAPLRREVGRGTFLTPLPQAPAVDAALILGRVSGVSPADMMAVRRIVEPEAAALAAATASDAEIAAIAAAHEAALAERETASFEGWDAEFHRRIFGAARNELLIGLHDLLRAIRNRRPWIELKRRTFSEPRRLAYCRDHAAILGAIAARDPGAAAAAMRAHMDHIGVNLFGRVEEPEPVRT